MIDRLTPAQLIEQLGLKTAKALAQVRAVRTPDGRWWLACRGFGLRDDDHPERWIAPYQSMTRDDAAELEAEPGRQRCGRGWALAWGD